MGLREKLIKKDPEVEQKELEEAQILADTGKVWQFLKESRRRTEFDWFINRTYYNNNQYLRYNSGARRVQNISVDKMADRVVINKVKQQVRGVVNFLNAEHPDIGVRPGDQADDAYMRAKKEKHLADYWYRHLKLNKTSKIVSNDAAQLGVGIVKVTFNNDAITPTTPFKDVNGDTKDYTYGELAIDRCDPFEVYWDQLASDKSSMRYITHAVVRTIAELRANPLYKNTDKLTPDSRLSASILKQSELRLNIANGATITTGQPNGMDTCVVLEMYRKIFNKDTGKWEVWVTTRTESGVLLRHDKWLTDEFPFEFFCTDVTGLISESKGVIHDIREPNRALNEMVSQVHETARIMGKLNWLIPRGSNVNVITDETGQFIEYDVTPGGAPRQADAAGLPAYINQHIGMLQGFIEDISGMHSSFNGKAPFAQASGDLVEQLSMGDQNNLTTMRDNYDDFFIGLFKLMFKTAKAGYTTTRTFPSGVTDEFGETQWLELKPNEINTSDDLVISTGTAMPYSIAQKQQMYMNLWKEKAISDPAVLFRLLEMPDVDAAMGDDEADVERQLDEIRMIMKGQKPNDPEVFESHDVHIKTLDKFAKGSGWAKLNDEQKQMLRDHRQKHITFSIQLAQIAASMNFEPIKRSETVMLRMNKMSDTTAIERTQLLSHFSVQSDAAQVQLRGGLYIQDPAQAEMQAQNEDIEMMDMRPVQVSFGDNHLVHIETHSAVINHPNFKAMPQTVQDLFLGHIKDHIQAMQDTQVSPGLVPNDQISMPQTPNLQDTGNKGNMPQAAGLPDNTPTKGANESKVAEPTSREMYEEGSPKPKATKKRK